MDDEHNIPYHLIGELVQNSKNVYAGDMSGTVKIDPGSFLLLLNIEEVVSKSKEYAAETLYKVTILLLKEQRKLGFGTHAADLETMFERPM